MGEIVNLRTRRKRAVREDASRKADANRVAFGLPKAERERAALERDIADRRIEGHRRETPDRRDERE